jgi:hypothetical protein
MRNLVLTVASSAVIAAGVSFASPPAQAAGIFGQGTSGVDQSSLIEQVQMRWHGARYCWYPRGWHGPGWYRCGSHMRRGYGWGGPMGWNSWTVPRGGYVGPGGRYAPPARPGYMPDDRGRPPGPTPGRTSGGMSGRGGTDEGIGGPTGSPPGPR